MLPELRQPSHDLVLQGYMTVHPELRRLAVPALMLKRSSRVMPGFLGTPAGMTTRSQPYSASGSLSAPVALLT